jgi:hypothetical protein
MLVPVSGLLENIFNLASRLFLSNSRYHPSVHSVLQDAMPAQVSVTFLDSKAGWLHSFKSSAIKDSPLFPELKFEKRKLVISAILLCISIILR